MTQRDQDIERFYCLIDRLEKRVKGKVLLKDCDGHEGWPQGVYFFFENGEFRNANTGELRVVRVGTHGAGAHSPSTLWWRLTQHQNDVGRSVFRDHVAIALRKRSRAKNREYPRHNHQTCVSRYIGRMPFLWVKVDGEDGHLRRGKIERNAIALLSFWHQDAIGSPSDDWLGNWRNHKIKKVERSGLWNVTYVTREYTSSFLDDLERCVDRTEPFETRTADWNDAFCVN